MRMVMKLLLAGLISAGCAGTAGAAPATPAASTPTKEQLQTAAFRFKVMYSAMATDKVPAPLKEALFACVYGHPMAEISNKMDQVIASNPKAKFDASSPDQQLALMAAVCGYKQPQPATPAKK